MKDQNVFGALGKVKRVRYDKFGVRERGAESAAVDGLIAVESVNCALGESLKAGVGVRKLVRADGSDLGVDGAMPEADYYFLLPTAQEDGTEVEKLGFVTYKGAVYLDDGELPVSRHYFGARTGGALVFDAENAAKMAFSSSAGVHVYSETAGMTETGVGSAGRAVCFYKERLFCVLPPFTLAYSAPLDATDFAESIDDGGRIALPTEQGEIVALKAFGGYLYAFYEYGISRIEIVGSAREFVVSPLEYGGGRIFGDSVGVCSVGGDKAFFLAGDGLYAFDGRKARRVCRELVLNPARNEQVCGHAESDGRYFVRFLDADGVARGVALEAEREVGYRCFAVKGLSACLGKALCYSGGDVCEIAEGEPLPVGEKYSFQAENLDFGVAGVKTLKTLRLCGRGSATLYVSAGGRTRRAAAKFSSGESVVYIGVRGGKFSLRIELKAGAEITALEAEVIK